MTTLQSTSEIAPVELLTDRRAIPPFAPLRAFEAVGRLGGVRKAAAELGVDHAVVSRHLRALEAWMGVALFDRSAAAPRLNAAGQGYHQVVSEAIMSIARGTREALRTESANRLLIWCVPGFASRWLSANLDHFVQHNPGVEVELRPTDASPNFGSDEADGDIRFVRDITSLRPQPGVNRLRFARPAVFPVASPEWVAANPPVRRPEDLIDHRLLHEENDEEWRGWFVANDVKPNPRLAGPKLWHAHLALDAARRGQGVALANPFLIADDISQGQLQVLLPAGDAGETVQIGAYVFSTREDAIERPAIRKFRDWIVPRAAEFLKREAKWAQPERQPTPALLG